MSPPTPEARALAGSSLRITSRTDTPGHPDDPGSGAHGSPRGTATEVESDAGQVDAEQARYLLELAGAYTRQALAFPDELAMLRGTVAELLLENAALRYQLDQLTGRVQALERRAVRR